MDQDPQPHQLLAAQVVRQALVDLDARSAETRSNARLFLAGSDALWFWCHIAGLDATRVISKANALSGGRDTRLRIKRRRAA